MGKTIIRVNQNVIKNSNYDAIENVQFVSKTKNLISNKVIFDIENAEIIIETEHNNGMGDKNPIVKLLKCKDGRFVVVWGEDKVFETCSIQPNGYIEYLQELLNINDPNGSWFDRLILEDLTPEVKEQIITMLSDNLKLWQSEVLNYLNLNKIEEILSKIIK